MNAATAESYPWHHADQTMGDREAVDPMPSGALPDSDIGLMERVREGDLAAFERLVETHQSRVIGTVAKMLGSPAEAEDIAQQVFIRVWKSAGRYRPTASFTTWLMTITRNLVFNEVRRRKRRPVQPMPTDPDTEAPREFADVAASQPDEALREKELQDAIREAIAQLPEAQRMAVVLSRYEEMSHEEIGRVLGVSVQAVKSLLFRARTALRGTLERYLRGVA